MNSASAHILQSTNSSVAFEIGSQILLNKQVLEL